MPVKLICPEKGKPFVIRSATAAKVSGRTIKCPLCHTVHDAILAPPAPPAEEAAADREPAGEAPAYSLFSVQAVTLATFLGSCIGGGIVLALNFLRMGRRPQAVQSIALGALGTLLVAFVAFNVPEKFPGVLVWLPPILVLQLIAKQLFATILADHEAAGGALASMWHAALIGVICLVVVVGGILLYILMNPLFPGTKIEIGKDEVYYSGEATEADARKFAADLEELGVLGQGGATVHLDKSSEGFAVSLVFRVKAWNDPEMKEAMVELGEKLADRGFGRPITVKMCDQEGEVHHTHVIR